MEFKILDKGELKLLDCMGSDSDIADSARVSYGKGTKAVSDDRNLLRYLMRNYHTSPFEMAELKFYIKAPIFIARQWVRHRVASWNEISGRYSVIGDDIYTPKELRLQSKDNKQGSSKETIKYDIQSYDKSTTEYQSLVNKDVAREQARIVLPLATYTEWIWKVDLHNLLHFLKLRLHSHAQQEFREYSKCIAKIVEKLFPITWEAFCDYRLNNTDFSSQETEMIKLLLDNLPKDKNYKELVKYYIKDSTMSKREKHEFTNKINRIMRS